MRVRIAMVVLSTLLSSKSWALCIPPLCACQVTTTSVAFGTYNPLAFGTVDSTGTVSVKCSGVAGLLIPYTVDLSPGTGTFADRRMASGAGQMSYNLYADASYSTVWGDGTASTSRVLGGIGLDLLGLSLPNLHVVYGRIPGRQLTVIPGTYVDTVNVVLTYY